METCTICGATKVWKEGGFRKDGSQYEGFMACPNYRNHPKQPDRGGFKKAEPPKQPPIVENLATKDDIEEILNALREIYKLIQGK